MSFSRTFSPPYIYDYNSNEKIDDSIKLLIQIIEIDPIGVAKESKSK